MIDYAAVWGQGKDGKSEPPEGFGFKSNRNLVVRQKGMGLF